MKKLKEIIDYLKLRHRAKQADYFAHITNGMCFRLVPPSYAILYGTEAVWKEIERQEDEAMKFIEEKCDKEVADDIRDYIMKDRAKRAEKRRQEALEEAKAQEEAKALEEAKGSEDTAETKNGKEG